MRARKAFTLVEILIVVVILGILAAIVVPQFTSATQDAMGGNLETQLDTLNNQLELYKARNNGQLPPNFVAGTTTGPSDPGPWTDLITQGYIKGPPQNPACPSYANGGAPGGLAVGAGLYGSANVGWTYDTTSNTIYASYFDEQVTHKITTTP
jgi:general secretion pathway protein G